MKRYLVFCGAHFYPDGGWNDFEGSYATLEEALEIMRTVRTDLWWHIIDTETGERVAAN